MAFELNAQEPLAAGLKRMLQEEADLVLACLDVPVDPHEAIHEARKGHKKIRAVLRMVRPVIGEKKYKRENAAYRNNARLLSDLRDATALIEAIGKLQQKAPGEMPASVFETLREWLEAQRATDAGSGLDETAQMDEARKRMLGQRLLTQSLPLKGNQFQLVRKGITQVYRRGYWASEHCQEDPTMEHIHDWRKRVKYLWYIVSILVPAWPALMTPLAAELKALSDLLGMWRDLGLLEEYLHERAPTALTAAETSLFLAQSQAYRLELLVESLTLGRRLYREKPRAFVYRLEGYWKEWQGRDF